MSAPSGDVALVFTDVEGSTERWERDPAAMRDALAIHDRVIRAAIETHRGYEVKTIGDAFMVAFATLEDAARFCIDAQQRLASCSELRVRMGVHRGVPIPQIQPHGRVDYLGPVVNKAARVEAAAHGGQVLVSEEAKCAIDAIWTDLGEHLLKGLEGRHRLWQLGHGDFPRPRTLEPRRTNLRSRADPFSGRTAEVEEVVEVVRTNRLVTLTGAGGVGKTRLAVRAGWGLLEDCPGGVWFCDLTEVRTADGIAVAAARALGLALDTLGTYRQVGDAIAGRGRCLVVLDNFEQVVGFAPDTVERWMNAAPDAHFLVTSREVLDLAGETVYALPPLSPADAFELFEQRARAAKHDFVVTDEKRRDIALLVDLLDRLPLAIELAAARVRVLPPSKLLGRLSDRFKLLAGRRGDGRHATLRGTLDWSWDLLQPDEQSALAQLSVFRGGFTVDAAEAVLRLDELWAVDALQSLVDKSLVQRPDQASERLTLLVSVQEYAAEKLSERAGREQAEVRHGAWYSQLGTTEGGARLLAAVGHSRLFHAQRAELDNLVAAHRRALARGDAEQAARSAIGAAIVLMRVGPVRAAEELLTASLAIDGASEHTRLNVQRHLGQTHRALEPTDANAERLDRVRHRLRELGARKDALLADLTYASLLTDLGRPDRALQALESAQAERVALDVDDQDLLSNQAGTALGRLGRHEEALAEWRRVVERRTRRGDLPAAGAALSNIAYTLAILGRPEEAREHAIRALEIHREVGARRFEAIALNHLGIILAELGETDQALEPWEESLRILAELGLTSGRVATLINVGLTLSRNGRGQDALALLEDAVRIAAQAGLSMPYAMAVASRAQTHLALDDLDAALADLSLGRRLVAEHHLAPETPPVSILDSVEQSLETILRSDGS